MDKQRRKLETRIGRIVRTKFHFVKLTDKGFLVGRDKIQRMVERYVPDRVEKLVKLETLDTNKITSFSSLPSFRNKEYELTEEDQAWILTSVEAGRHLT